MRVKKTALSDTEVKLEIIADVQELSKIKEVVLIKLAASLKLPGFRSGKAPLPLAEKNVDPMLLQNNFIDEALQQLYSAALEQENLRVIAEPKVEIKKYVPFSSLEFDVTLNTLGDIVLGDYKNLKAVKKKATVTDKDIDGVLDSLRLRSADRKDVTRAAKPGDQVWIDFTGKDSEGAPVPGADGKDYPLSIGSGTFIPGFEENIVGLKAGQSKEFNIIFPENYRVTTLRGQKVAFTVKVTKVQSVELPNLDDAFASKVAPVKTLAQLRSDIKRELLETKQQDYDRAYESELVNLLVSKSKLSAPDPLVEQQIGSMIDEQKQNVIYSGQTWQEYLQAQNKTDEAYRETIRPQAEQRVKAGLVLSAVAERENLKVGEEDVDSYLEKLNTQYTDPKMREELGKPEARRSARSRLLMQKTIALLVKQASKSR